MDVLSAMQTLRYLVAFDELEVSMLQALQLLPIGCAIPAKVWLTAEMVDAWSAVVGAHRIWPTYLATIREQVGITVIRTIHILTAGRPRCAFSQQVPGKWDPAEHVWIDMRTLSTFAGDQQSTFAGDQHSRMCDACSQAVRMQR